MSGPVCAKWLLEHLLGGVIGVVGETSVKCTFQISTTQTLAATVSTRNQCVVQTIDVKNQTVVEETLPSHSSLPEVLGGVGALVATARGILFAMPARFRGSYTMCSDGISTKAAMAHAVNFVRKATNCRITLTMQTMTTNVLSVGSRGELGVVIFDSTTCTTTCVSAREPTRHALPIELNMPTYMWTSRDSGEAVVETCRVVLALVDQILTARITPARGL